MMEEKEKVEHSPGTEDPRRAAYMIAWRDRHIEKQKELIAGYEEQLALMEGLLALALLQKAEQEGDAHVVCLSKKALSETLGSYTATVESDDTSFTVRFLPKTEPTDGGEQKEP